MREPAFDPLGGKRVTPSPPDGSRPPPFPFWGLIALPGGAVFGTLLGVLVGAMFGIPGIGVAIGAGLGIGTGLAVLAAAIVVASGRQ